MLKIGKMLFLILAPSMLLIAGAVAWFSWPKSNSGRLKAGSYAILKDGTESAVSIGLGRPHEIIPNMEAMGRVPAGTRVVIVSDDAAPEFPSYPESREVLVNVKEGPMAGIAGHLPRKNLIPE